MLYHNVSEGTFISRPNRFIAEVETDEGIERCHVKNTGRCKELLVKGADVILTDGGNPKRKTKYDLVSVYKGNRLINMDSQMPNKVVYESLEEILGPCDSVRPEYTVGDSRFDIYAEQGGKKILLEVKGVTLEEDGVVMFPDAPTERGLKHVTELGELASQGYECRVMFLVQMSDVKYFTPNYAMQEEFGRACETAASRGVHLMSRECNVTKNSVTLGKPVEIRLRG